MYTSAMTQVRRRLAPVAMAWLLSQAATLVVVPAIFFLTGTAPLECTCVHDGDHRNCPMHHASPMQGKRCVKTTDDGAVAALGSLLGHVAPIPESQFVPLTPEPRPAIQLDAVLRSHRPSAPEPPPPRA